MSDDWHPAVGIAAAIFFAAVFIGWIYFGGMPECQPDNIGTVMLLGGCPQH